MPCFYPLHGWRAKHTNPSGKRGIVFDPNSGYRDLPVTLPCGRCQGCRLERSRQWAIRCVHEAQLHDENAFLTLTYNDEHLPPDGSLNHRHFQLFMKLLRKELHPLKIRYFMCGEYGAKLSRPHYHCILFGYNFNDRQLYSDTNGMHLYISPLLSRLWHYGFSTIGDVSFESCAYVARYIMKKVNGEDAFEHYMRADDYGEMFHVKPEYTCMSRRKGIGYKWLEKFKDDVYPGDHVVLNGREFHPPKYYDKILEENDPQLHQKIKRERKNNLDQKEHTPERLAVREKVQKARLTKLKRKIEDEA